MGLFIMKGEQNNLIIIGAGGHGQVAASILFANSPQPYQLVGFLDDNPSLTAKSILGKKVLGTVAELPEIKHDCVFIAVGENNDRTSLYHNLSSKGEKFVNLVHPDAIIASDVEIGQGVIACAGVVINTGTKIGNNVILNTGCTIDHHNRIDDHVHIAPGAHLGGDVRVGMGSLVGMGAIITPQNVIGERSIVGAGAVVRKDIADSILAAGVPAEKIRDVTEEDHL